MNHSEKLQWEITQKAAVIRKSHGLKHINLDLDSFLALVEYVKDLERRSGVRCPACNVVFTKIGEGTKQCPCLSSNPS